ncbi:anaerobic sulfatase maturase [Vibrio sp. VB16]|uniref:anaerobic sulfatase maturase n=1 Tax=Vibrio sp. VB16 TaxID=2785746 RepID=UPI00189F11BD|nr:anaerobic sulfatase maturase [Vibrio sp. VB16]UGA56933.1 anaerobic sulfatase maturase [Vibrio sp. VB16]
MGIDNFSPYGCHVMAKPSSSKCNIDCTYCFYLEKEKLYPESSKTWQMDDETLEQYVIQQIEAQSSKKVVFAWQGGEPTLLGLDFFRKAISLQQKYGVEKDIINTLQTNGILLNEEWCLFFKEHRFLIGISIDGPEELHDTYRRTRSGKATHRKVVEAIVLLNKFTVEFNTLTVVSNANARSPIEVYHYLKSIGSKHMQFIPLVERQAQEQTKDGLTLLHPERLEAVQLCDWSVESEQFGLFMSAIFHEWVRVDVGLVWVQLFENTYALTCEQPAQICVFSPTCGSAFALESNGDIYACDHYVFPEFKLGNIHETSIKHINEGQDNRQFGLNKKQSLSNECLNCDHLHVCNGGCPKHRFALSLSKKPEQNYLCSGYKTFFSYSAPYMDLMKKLYQAGHPPSAIMQIIKKKES